MICLDVFKLVMEDLTDTTMLLFAYIITEMWTYASFTLTLQKKQFWETCYWVVIFSHSLYIYIKYCVL